MGKMLRGEPITIWGDGNVVRDFFYVGDLIDAIAVRKEEASELKEKINEEAESLVEADEAVTALEEELEKCETAITISSIDELYEIKNNIKRLKDKLEELENVVNPYLEPLKELEAIELEPIDMDSINELDNLSEIERKSEYFQKYRQY